MGIVGGFDIDRRQITFDYVDSGTGEVSRGKISSVQTAGRGAGRHGWGVSTGVVTSPSPSKGARDGASSSRSSHGVGAKAHLAEPADTAKERGRKQRAKTDRTDAWSAARAPGHGPAARVLDPP